LWASGLSWCPTKPVRVGLASLTSKVLCAEHNSALSETDAEAAHFINVLRQQLALSERRIQARRTDAWSVVRYCVSGPLFERWLLKTMINLSLTMDKCEPIGLAADSDGPIPHCLVETAFKRRPFEGRSGLYFAARRGLPPVEPQDRVYFKPLVHPSGRITVGFFHFHGLLVLLSLHPEPVRSKN